MCSSYMYLCICNFIFQSCKFWLTMYMYMHGLRRISSFLANFHCTLIHVCITSSVTNFSYGSLLHVVSIPLWAKLIHTYIYTLYVCLCNAALGNPLNTFLLLSYFPSSLPFFSFLVSSPESVILTSGYTTGSGPIFLDQLTCSGTEQSLLDCSSGRPVGLHQCDHSMDIGLTCQGVYAHACYLYM